MELTNRTILITGGASGIGYAMARQLDARNNRVIVCGRNQHKLDKAKQELPGLETVRCDINNPDDLNDLSSFLSVKYPQLDTLINNAGIQQQLNLTSNQVTDQAVMHEIGTNLTSHIGITHRLYSLLSSNRNPAIVFIGSACAIAPKYNAPIYSAAKAGLHNFVQSLRHQAEQDDVQVIEVIPDVVNTPMTHHRHNEAKMDADIFASQVLKQLVTGNREILIGRARALRLLHKIAPALALMAINKTSAV